MLEPAVDVYFFDFDRTLYSYDFRFRLPALARLSGVSQYHLARTWWADGYERRAIAGEWPTADEYLDQFAEVTGGRRLSLEEWAGARASSMAPIQGSIAALRRAADLGIVSLLSDNPSAFRAALPQLAPDVVEILDDHLLVSCEVKARKPSREIFERALARYGVDAADAFFVDDIQANVAGAREVGLTAHWLEYVDGVPQTDALQAAIEAFASRPGRSL